MTHFPITLHSSLITFKTHGNKALDVSKEKKKEGYSYADLKINISVSKTKLKALTIKKRRNNV